MFCAKCGIELIMSNNNLLKCSEHGIRWELYRNAPCAEVFLVSQEKVLLIKRAQKPKIGHWAIPGGFSDYGEHPIDTAKREILEEAGWVVKVAGILGIYLDKFPGDEFSETRLVISYLARPVKKNHNKLSAEISDCAWFDVNEPPKKLIGIQKNRFTDYRAKAMQHNI